MRNLNKKISVVVLSGMMVVSGAVSSGISIYANSSGAKVSDRINSNDVVKLKQGESRHGYEILAFSSDLNDLREKWDANLNNVPYYDDLLIRHFKDISSFLSQVNSLSRYGVYRLQIGKMYYIVKFNGRQNAFVKKFLDSKGGFKSKWFKDPDGAKAELVASEEGDIADVIGAQGIYNYRILNDNPDESEIGSHKLLKYKDGDAFLSELLEKGMERGIFSLKVGSHYYIIKSDSVKPGRDIFDYKSQIKRSEVSNIAQVKEMQGVFSYSILDCNSSNNKVLYEKYGLKSYNDKEELKKYGVNNKEELYSKLGLGKDKVEVKKYADGADFISAMMFRNERPKDEGLHRIMVGDDEFIIVFAREDVSKNKEGL